MLHSEICMFGVIENGKNFCLQKYNLLKPSPLYRKDQNCPSSCARGKFLASLLASVCEAPFCASARYASSHAKKNATTSLKIAASNTIEIQFQQPPHLQPLACLEEACLLAALFETSVYFCEE